MNFKFLGSLFSEIESLNQLQLLEKKIEDLTIQKDQLQTEVNEFRIDSNLLIDNIVDFNKKIYDHLIAKNKIIFDKTNDKSILISILNYADENKNTLSSKIFNNKAVNYFDKLKKHFEIIITNLNVHTDDLNNYKISNEIDNSINNKDNLNLMIKFVDELNEKIYKLDKTLNTSSSLVHITDENIEQITPNNDLEFIKNNKTEIKVMIIFFYKLKNSKESIINVN